MQTLKELINEWASMQNAFYYLYKIQQFMGRTNRLRSFDKTRTSQKMKILGGDTQTQRQIGDIISLLDMIKAAHKTKKLEWGIQTDGNVIS
jgi:hypothetical protein